MRAAGTGRSVPGPISSRVGFLTRDDEFKVSSRDGFLTRDDEFKVSSSDGFLIRDDECKVSSSDGFLMREVTLAPDAGFCVEALNEALARYGRPEIFNTDQGSQFTSVDFTGVLKHRDIAISMDGRGRCMDNIFIERLWRSLKYEAVYLHELTDGFVAERVISGWIDFYSSERPHSALDDMTPAEAYSRRRPVDMMDKARALPTSPQAQQPQKRLKLDRKLAA